MHLKLAPNVVDPPKKIFLDQVGFYSCRRCVMCKTSRHRVRKTTYFTSHAQGESHKIRKFITCGTTHFTYLLACPCGLQYVGRTTWKLGVRLQEHVNRIRKGYIYFFFSFIFSCLFLFLFILYLYFYLYFYFYYYFYFILFNVHLFFIIFLFHCIYLLNFVSHF